MPDRTSTFPRPCHALAALLIACICLATSPLQAQEDFDFSLKRGEGPWRLRADRVVFDQDIQEAEAFGDVVITRGDATLKADYARYLREINWVRLQGNVDITFGQKTLQAEEAEFDLDSETGILKDGRVFLVEPHLYVRGERMEKTGADTYEFERASVTSCDGDRPAWSFKASSGSLTIGEYGRLWNPRFRVKDFPVLYAPFVTFPVKRERQSGVLRPEVSTSDLQGYSVNLPYYQVINEEQDVTFYANYMAKRGARPGLEYRLTPNAETMGVFRADWLKDRTSAETVQEEFDQFDDDRLVRSNEHRYWVRGKLDGFLIHPDWRTKLDLDLVSDQNYLREFDSGYSGFDESRRLFLNRFGRDINDKDSLIRENVLALNRSWSGAGLETRLEYNQNLNYFNNNHLDLDPDENDTLQRLPELGLDFYKQGLPGTPFDWEAENELTYFWRRFGTTGTLIDLHPQISLPLQSGYGTLIPKIGWRETAYHINRFEESSPDIERRKFRGIWDFNVNGFTELFRVFDLVAAPKPTEANAGETRWTKLKHSLRPQIEYDYIPFKDQSAFAANDFTGTVNPVNELTYSLTSVLTARTESVTGSPGSGFGVDTGYLDFLRLKLEQSYDFREANRSSKLDQFPRRPFSDIRLELSLEPFPWFDLENRTWISPYLWDVTEHEHMLRLSFRDWGRAYFGYDFQRRMEEDIRRRNQDELKILRAGGALDVTGSWRLSVDYEKDLSSGELIERRAGIAYSHQCWQAEINYSESPNEQRVEFLITLKELGEIGQEFAVPGE
jgi:LPS-assembly protein